MTLKSGSYLKCVKTERPCVVLHYKRNPQENGIESYRLVVSKAKAETDRFYFLFELKRSVEIPN